jgi:hypothetical protein
MKKDPDKPPGAKEDSRIVARPKRFRSPESVAPRGSAPDRLRPLTVKEIIQPGRQALADAAQSYRSTPEVGFRQSA